MEPTITQNSALYLAYQKVSKRRAALFRRQLTSRDVFSVLHQDNGR